MSGNFTVKLHESIRDLVAAWRLSFDANSGVSKLIADLYLSEFADSFRKSGSPDSACTLELNVGREVWRRPTGGGKTLMFVVRDPEWDFLSFQWRTKIIVVGLE